MKKKEIKKCLDGKCKKNAMKNDLYCYDHGLERDAALEDQAWSVSDDREPWE